MYQWTQQLVQLEQGALMAKIEIQQAYRNIPVHPEDCHLLGMEWGNEVLVDKVLPFGLRSALKIFCAIADALAWILGKTDVACSIHYIDDLSTVGPPDSCGVDQCRAHLDRITETCNIFRLPLKTEKVEGPMGTITFLGIVLDSIKIEIQLPEEKA